MINKRIIFWILMAGLMMTMKNTTLHIFKSPRMKTKTNKSTNEHE